jgi:hypothetical protein
MIGTVLELFLGTCLMSITISVSMIFSVGLMHCLDDLK